MIVFMVKNIAAIVLRKKDKASVICLRYVSNSLKSQPEYPCKRYAYRKTCSNTNQVNFKGRTSGNQSDFCNQALNLSMHID